MFIIRNCIVILWRWLKAKYCPHFSCKTAFKNTNSTLNGRNVFAFLCLVCMRFHCGRSKKLSTRRSVEILKPFIVASRVSYRNYMQGYGKLIFIKKALSLTKWMNIRHIHELNQPGIDNNDCRWDSNPCPQRISNLQGFEVTDVCCWFYVNKNGPSCNFLRSCKHLLFGLKQNVQFALFHRGLLCKTGPFF